MADWIQRLADIALNIATTAWTFTLGIIFTLRATFNDGVLVNAPSTSNRAGVTATGNGMGAGISATGGSGGGVGGVFIGGAGGGGVAGATFQGGGTGGVGASFVGGSAARGATFVGGAGVAAASMTNGTAATGGTRQDALTLVNGDLDMSSVAYPNASTAMANRLGPMHFAKAWAVITITGAGTFTITVAAGCNIASVARASASTFTITFGTGFTNGTYGVLSTCIATTSVGAGANVELDPATLIRAAGSITAGLSVNGTSVASLDGWGGGNQAVLTVVFWGQQ